MLKKFLLISFLFLLLPPTVFAADFKVDCNDTGCSSSGESPLFSDSEVWYPGKVLTKTFSLLNSTGETMEMTLKGRRTGEESLLEEVFNLTLLCGGRVLWSGSLESFYGLPKVDIGTFSPGGAADCSLSASMDASADNNYQKLSAVFDLDFSFLGEPATEGGGGGQILGYGVSAPSCDDSKPEAPTNLSAIALGGGRVALSWTAPVSPYTYFLVAYSDNQIAPKWGNPNVGTATSYTVSGLGSGNYWFWVRAGNGCMPGDFTGPVLVSLAGAGGGEIARGFEEGVLGVKTKNEEKPGGLLGGGITTESGQVKGAAVKNYSKIFFGLLFLVLFLIFYLYLYLRRKIIRTS